MKAKMIIEFKKKEMQAFGKTNISNNKTFKEFTRWFLENACQFTREDVNIELSKMYADLIDAEIKQCHHNAWLTSITNKDLKYFTGFYISRTLPLPIEHSFLVTKNKRIVDPTSAITKEKMIEQAKKTRFTHFASKHLEDMFGVEYMGIEIPLKILNNLITKNGATRNYLLDYYNMVKSG